MGDIVGLVREIKRTFKKPSEHLGTMLWLVFDFHRLIKALLGISGLVIFTIFVDHGRVLLLRRNLPPGPLPLPIVGNHLHLPKSKPWKKIEEWSKYYNDPLITVWIGRVPNIFVNDCWTAADLMEKRANIYSSRPKHIVLGEMLNNSDYNQTLLPYGDKWRVHRKLTVRSMLVKSDDST